jgi:hypothetical protein
MEQLNIEGGFIASLKKLVDKCEKSSENLGVEDLSKKNHDANSWNYQLLKLKFRNSRDKKIISKSLMIKNYENIISSGKKLKIINQLHCK